MYDCYLEILHVVDEYTWQALHQDEVWKICHVCPPCLYKLKDELLIKYFMLAAMDGNNLLKLVDSTFHSGTSCTDGCISMSSRWISPEDVDHEVSLSHQKVSHPLHANMLSLTAFPIAVNATFLACRKLST